MNKDDELWQALRRFKSVFVTVAILSAVLNVLVLGGSIYMMLVYDSVLPSHSIPSLVGLLVLVAIVYLFQGFFDNLRSSLLADAASGLDHQVSRRVQMAISKASLNGYRMAGDGIGPMRDLESVRAFMSGGGLISMIDLPWIAFFIAILCLLHVWLGVTALIGAIVLLSLTVLTNRLVKVPTTQATQAAAYRNSMAETNLRHAELLTALGMRGRMQDRWEQVNNYYLSAQGNLSRIVGTLGGASKVLRMFLQSVILSVGALLVINGEASGGVIFASSILSGRALAPVDQAIANWRGFASARAGWKRLAELLDRVPAEQPVHTLLPRPHQTLAAQQLFVVPPGTQQPTVQGVDFTIRAGDALGMIGPSGAGKSSLGRALLGIWPPARGCVRLDGATLDQWNSDTLGEAFGYLPQNVELLDGTIAENISRFEPDAPSDLIIAAAQAAAVHDLIVGFPSGYDTRVGIDGADLSAGQRQRVGLARALYRDPFLVLLDEPNSNLDAEGEAALEKAIASVREREGIAIVISHRLNVLRQVNYVLLLREGRMSAFGPRDEILQKLAPKPVPIEASSAAPAPPVANEA